MVNREIDESAPLSKSLARSRRMSEARRRGTHTRGEWETLKSSFSEACARCGAVGTTLEKDRIRIISAGGSDAIENIQPLCPSCTKGTGIDYRPKDWRRRYQEHAHQAPGRARRPMMTCQRCEHEWTGRGDAAPRVCPRCKSPYWDRPRRSDGVPF